MPRLSQEEFNKQYPEYKKWINQEGFCTVCNQEYFNHFMDEWRWHSEIIMLREQTKILPVQPKKEDIKLVCLAAIAWLHEHDFKVHAELLDKEIDGVKLTEAIDRMTGVGDG